MDDDAEWDRWTAWIGDDVAGPSISKDVVSMIASRQIWESFATIHDAAPEEVRRNPTFLTWTRRNYVGAQALCIRRQTETPEHDTPNLSLARLLDRIATVPQVLSRDRYANRASGWSSKDEADRLFDELIGKGDHLPREVPMRDLDRLLSVTEPVRRWATKEMAHYDRKTGSFGSDVTFDKLNESIDVVVGLTMKYRELILGVDTLASISMTPWERIFRLPWIADDDALRELVAGARAREEDRRLLHRVDETAGPGDD